MTMDPRIEAALIEFAHERLVPPGYTIENVRNAQYDVHIHQPWVVKRGDWSAWAKTLKEAVAAAWAHSDRIDVAPPGYEVRACGRAGGWLAIYTGPPHWSFEDATRVGAIAKAWAHHDLHGPFEQHHDASTIAALSGETPREQPLPPTKFSPGDCVRWAPNRDGKFLYGILVRRRGYFETHATSWEVSNTYVKRDGVYTPMEGLVDAIVAEPSLELMSPSAWETEKRSF